jgi:hypothetical protein
MSTAESQVMADTFHRDPDKVRKVQFVHQPPGGETVRATVEYVGGRGESTRDRQVLARRLPRRAQPRRQLSVAPPPFT